MLRMLYPIPTNNRPQIEHHNSSNNAVASSVSPFAPQQNNEQENHGDIRDRMPATLQHMQQQWNDERANEQMANSFYQSLNLANNLPSTSAPQLHCEFQNRVQDGERMLVDQEGFVVPETNGLLETNWSDEHNNELENHGDIGDEMQAAFQQWWSDECANEQMDELEGYDPSFYLVKNLSSTFAPQQHSEFQDRVQDGERMQVDQEGFVVPQTIGLLENSYAEPDLSFDEVNNSFSTSAPLQQSEFQNRVRDGEQMQADQECFEGGGKRSCTPVPDHVQSALADASTSRKRPRIEHPSSINNNDSNNQEQGYNGQQMHEACQRVEDILQRGSTSADYRWDNTSALLGPMTGFQECIIGSDQEVNNSASTSAPQQNNESENQMQAGQEVVRGTSQECFAMLESSGDGVPFPAEKLVGAAFKQNKRTVLRLLKSNKVSSIGIYGMGGVGKTTLLTHIYNKILKYKSKFGDVYWITVSQDFSVKRLQNLIAESIGLEFGNEEDLKKRAAKLSKELRKKCKLKKNLILDDIWNYFDVKEIGIPTEVNGCKLIVTTRSLKVCRWINCQEELKVEPLLRNEAWKLFLKTLGNDLEPGVELIARSVVGECAGLALGIVTMARSMRGVKDIRVWQNALTELQKSKVKASDMEDKVFKILRFSYARLNEEPALQECLLYCALYPEDSAIDKKELIEELIVEGIIERMDSIQEALNKGYAMLNTLENSCLLECRRGMWECKWKVKMHDLIRDMAIQIMKECSPSLVEAGKQLTCLPDEKWWTEDTVRVSLMNNDIREISSHYSPRCPKLSTLILSNNTSLQSIAEPFFHQLLGIKVLNISCTKIEKLPESVGDLEKLTALILRCCRCLKSLPSLRKLKALEMLNLYGCSEFEKVPEGLESLLNLNYLNLLDTGVKNLTVGILTSLSHLQFLGFLESPSLKVKIKGEEVGSLCSLETLFWRFNDKEDYNNYMRSLSNKPTEKQLSQFFIHVGPMNNIPREISCSNCGQVLYFSECNMCGEVLLPKDVQKLNIAGLMGCYWKGLCLKNAINLKEFNIGGCKEIEYLFCLSSSPFIFQTLETLRIGNMEKLRGLFSKDGDDGVIPLTPMPRQLLPTATFSRLKKFTLEKCHSMKKLFPYALLSNLQNLQWLEVCDCSEMEEIEGGSNSLFILPNLRRFYLRRLPKLKTICNAELKCDSLQHFRILACPELKKIPISLPLSSLELIVASPREWWKTVEWGHPNNKVDLKGFLHLVDW